MKKLALTTGILVILTVAIGVTFSKPILPLGEVTNPKDIDYIAPIDFNGKEIVYAYTDDNTGEDLIIATDSATYSSWDSAYVNFAIKNISGNDQNIKVQFLYDGGASASTIEEVVFDVPYQVTVEDRGSKDYTCDSEWAPYKDDISFSTENAFVCGKENPRHCDIVVKNTCTVNDDIIGNHQETKYKDVYLPIDKSVVENLKSRDVKVIDSKFVAKEQVSNFIEAGQTKHYRALLKFNNNLVKRTGEWPEKTNGEFYINAYGDQGATGHLDPWYNASWLYRKSITIDETKVSGSADHTSFPVLVDLTDSGLQANAQADGDDILFTSSDGTTKLDHEIELYTSGTGRLTAWVRIPTLDYNDNTVIYMYYGNAGASSQQNATGVWDSNYKGVYHLNESAVNYIDSTSNANHGTTTSGTVTQVGAKIYNGQNFAGTSYIRIPNFITSYPVTVEYWATTTVTTNNPQFNIVNTGINVAGGFSGSGAYYYTGVNGKGAATSGFVNGNWNHVVVVQTSSSAVTVYTNGVDNSTTTNTLWNAGATSAIGARTTGGFTGRLDEFRVSDATRSADWVATSYNNQSATSTFYTIGTQETDTATAVPDRNRRLLSI